MYFLSNVCSLSLFLSQIFGCDHWEGAPLGLGLVLGEQIIVFPLAANLISELQNVGDR